jgi:hypothetical protein
MDRVLWALALALVSFSGCAIGATDEFKTASTHAMQYYISLPEHWSASKNWPVVFVIESANRDFEAAAEDYRRARGTMPFILVTPLVVSNGGPRYREAPGYHYSDAAWAEVTRAGVCRFDSEGLAAVAADVRRIYHGEDRYFITGLEAAGHTIWTQVFTHPEVLRAAAPVAPNYLGRCVEELGFSTSPTRAQLPVKIFGGSRDEYWAAGKPFYAQTQQAKSVAETHGYRNVAENLVQGKGHEPLAAEVMAYFESLVR